MAKKKSIRRKIAKGKNWYRVLAPKAFNENEVGEALAFDSEKLRGRLIKANYSEIARDITKHHITCTLKVTDIINDTAHTELVEYSLSKPFLQRVIRRKTSKIDQVIDMKLKDKNIRMKCVAVTVYQTTAAQRTALRHAIDSEVRKAVGSFDFDGLSLALATGKLQREINKKLKPIFPVKFLEFRKVEILKPKKVKADLEKVEIKEVEKKESKRTGKKIKVEAEPEVEQKAEEPKEEKPVEVEEIPAEPAA